jgi:antitoxin component YwqK of YwqJK toxin-antitoxin module
LRYFFIPKGWLSLGITVFLILTTVSCEKKVMQKDTILRRGILYQKGEDQPFTGIVVGKGREGYRRMVCTFEKAYKKGLQHGVTTYWYENGNLESTENYLEGKLHGLVTRYYPSGKSKARIDFDHGMRGGIKGEMFWDHRGRKIRK